MPFHRRTKRERETPFLSSPQLSRPFSAGPAPRRFSPIRAYPRAFRHHHGTSLSIRRCIAAVASLEGRGRGRGDTKGHGRAKKGSSVLLRRSSRRWWNESNRRGVETAFAKTTASPSALPPPPRICESQLWEPARIGSRLRILSREDFRAFDVFDVFKIRVKSILSSPLAFRDSSVRSEYLSFSPLLICGVCDKRWKARDLSLTWSKS